MKFGQIASNASINAIGEENRLIADATGNREYSGSAQEGVYTVRRKRQPG